MRTLNFISICLKCYRERNWIKIHSAAEMSGEPMHGRWLTIVTFLSLFSVGSYSAPANSSVGPDDPTYQCRQPESPLYNPIDANDTLDITIISNFDWLSDSRNRAEKTLQIDNIATRQRGVLRTQSPYGKTTDLPILVTNRGNLRGSACAFPQLRLSFLDRKIGNEIEDALRADNVSLHSPEYLPQYYRQLNRTKIDLSSIKSPKGTLFAKLGDDIKIVTHCGGLSYSNESESVQDRKIYREYYLYKMLRI